MNKHTIEYIKNYFVERECVLLSGVYVNNATKMQFKCRCGHVSHIPFAQFRKSPQCNQCGIAQLKLSKKQPSICNKCNIPLTNDNTTKSYYGNICRACYNLYHKKVQPKHGKRYYVKTKEQRAGYFKIRAEQKKKDRWAVRLEVVSHYSPDMCCVKCGFNDIRALSVDHINSDGSKHRKEDKSARFIYKWLKKHDYPEGFQILCMNCNFIKRYENNEMPHAR